MIDKENYKLYQKKYYQDNKERILSNRREYYKNMNQEKMKLYHKIYNKKYYHDHKNNNNIKNNISCILFFN